MNSDAIIEISGLKKAYDGTVVLDIPSYTFTAGGIYALVGPNGSGKTTLLLILSLLLSKSSGSLRFDGIDLTEHNLYELRKNITLVHQEPTMFQATVEKNVAMGLLYRGASKDVIADEVDRALKTVGLSRLKDRNARTLSGGETKRVAIARALAIHPRVVLLDEPTANVDIHNVAKIEQIIRDVNDQYDTTVIFSTHNLRQAYHIANHVLTLLEGRPHDFELKNFFSGTPSTRNGEPVFDTGRITVSLSYSADSARHITINPKEIIVSNSEIQSSARNRFTGEIVAITKDGHTVSLIVDVGERFNIHITMKSLEEMGLTIGKTVHIAFKAQSVIAY